VLRAKYGDERLTEIVPAAIGQFNVKQLIPDEDMVAILTKGGYIKRFLPPSIARRAAAARGGSG
jgi:DNA gyrase subunit A